MSRVILLELNELTPRLMDHFIDEGHLPGFKRLRDESIVCVSDAKEKPPNLEPWIQWVTVHSGLSFAEHKVFSLGDGPKLGAPRIWDIVSDAGKKVWVCGSMNAAVRNNDINGMVLPDPWAIGISPKPEPLFRPYFKLISSYVQEYTRDKPPLKPKQYIDFLMFMLSHGLSKRTVMEAVRQLAGERRSRGRWRRAPILDSLQWDVFEHFYKKLKPTFSTFFLNSTAHYQHYYWRNMEPEKFTVKPSNKDQFEYSDAILFGYKKMDAIVSQTLDLADPDTTVVLCTALGQQPLLQYEQSGGRQLFKPLNIEALMKLAGITANYRYAPVMAEEFKLFFDDSAAAADAAEKLLALRLSDGSSVMKARLTNEEIFAGCTVFSPPPPDTEIKSPFTNDVVKFSEVFYLIEAGLKSGMHHPHGILWLRTPERRHAVVDRLVSLQEIAPTLLDIMEIRNTPKFSFPPIPELSPTFEDVRAVTA